MSKSDRMARIFRWQDTAKAVMVQPCKGKFTRFQVGEIVNVRRSWKGARHWEIDRVSWRKPWVPLANQMFGVPRSAFKFL